ncbi:MAG TPA: hypothetical protein DEP18_07800 [Flavobacteriales bacterium]|nr:hypothetical protein [Flavobacteriales bacterium]HCA83676.1 hypothetical protein [Flavobacteriales bacterium]HRE74819.1 ABC transporter ATP-binding protein [Flavobacteriales bacterium]HRJ35288.1 ABC transporter ATP-binding protein [Flavobacteriales bacterium]HRJ38427.1 ABC transporter ATP-binding protein [Flavobacteriales bacterium]
MAAIITVENLSKSYMIRHEGRERYVALRDVVSNKAKSLFSGKRELTSSAYEEFKALDDVSFTIEQGDRVAIVGRNGAGKSTLLKILSRITSPTKGRIILDGRVASLLEVGTGFHPELSGRENIFLNGSILGMSKAEIKSKFDEIVAFSEVERFLDTPVKRYSSGMYVRLAFAVAAHLEPEILVVDEVLAVGDAAFQKKCIGKMQDVSKSGRTVLFVSHNMSAVRNLCNKAILLQNGKLIVQDEVEPVLERYLASNQTGQLTGNYTRPDKKQSDVMLSSAAVVDAQGEERNAFEIIEQVGLKLNLTCNKPVPNLYGYVVVKNSNEEVIIESDTKDLPPNALDGITEGNTTFLLTIPANTLSVGEYTVYLSFSSSFAADFSVETPGDVLRFAISDSITERGHNRRSYTSVLLNWQKK